MSKIFMATLLGLSAVMPAYATEAILGCDGQIAIVYHEKVRTGGTLDGILEAAKAQEAWYRAQGVTTNKIVVARVVKYDAKTKQSAYAADELYNFHVNPPPRAHEGEEGTGQKPDYIGKYKANATILDKATICLPKF